MKIYLLYKNYNLIENKNKNENVSMLFKDLSLDILLENMSQNDAYIYEKTREIIYNILTESSTSEDTIIFRQEILKDCIKNRELIYRLYNLLSETIDEEKNIYFGIFGRTADSVLNRSIEVLNLFITRLIEIKNLLLENLSELKSEGLYSFTLKLKEELNDTYTNKIFNLLKELKFKKGMLIKAELGKGNKGTNYNICKFENSKGSFFLKKFTKINNFLSFSVSENDLTGIKTLMKIKSKGISGIANILAQTSNSILKLLNTLKSELSFYIGSINLFERLKKMNLPVTFPSFFSSNNYSLSFDNLYDVTLALSLNKDVIKNDLKEKDKVLYIITGANKGGKTTFLRSIGISFIMMKLGMFVPAGYFKSSPFSRIFTHFTKEEDDTLQSGKLDEELDRLNRIISEIDKNSILLFNEPFETTNEIEGSEISKQIIKALVEKGVRVFMVTHLYSLSSYLFELKENRYEFLRAERLKNGKRTYKIIKGKPLPTSFGKDLYNRIFYN